MNLWHEDGEYFAMSKAQQIFFTVQSRFNFLTVQSNFIEYHMTECPKEVNEQHQSVSEPHVSPAMSLKSMTLHHDGQTDGISDPHNV